MKIASLTLVFNSVMSTFFHAHAEVGLRGLLPFGRGPGGGAGPDCTGVVQGGEPPEGGTPEFKRWAICQDIDCSTVDLTANPPPLDGSLESITWRRCRMEDVRQNGPPEVDCTGVTQGGDPPVRDGSGAFRDWVRCQDFDCTTVDLTTAPPPRDGSLDSIMWRKCFMEANRFGSGGGV